MRTKAPIVPPLRKTSIADVLRQLGQVGQGAFPGLPVLAEGFAQEDGRRRAAVPTMNMETEISVCQEKNDIQKLFTWTGASNERKSRQTLAKSSILAENGGGIGWNFRLGGASTPRSSS